MSDGFQACYRYLQKKHIRVQNEWLEACIEWIIEENGVCFSQRMIIVTLLYLKNIGHKHSINTPNHVIFKFQKKVCIYIYIIIILLYIFRHVKAMLVAYFVLDKGAS